LALRLRPELEALRAASERAEVQVDLAEKAFYPDLGVGLTYFDLAERDAPATATGRDALAVMVSAKIPLQRGRLRARREQAQVRAAQVQARQDALRTAIATELADALYAAEREAETLALYRQRLLPQARATAESVLAAYATGEADYLALLEAERARFQIALGLEDALARYLLATARLERALGTSLSETAPLR
jgi:outer membrane protein TolC